MQFLRFACLLVVASLVVCSFTTPGQCATTSDQNKSVQLYDDPRVVAWSRDYLAGKEAAVLQSVEQDLRSANPHPFAAQVWTVIHQRRKRLAHVWNQIQDQRLRAALGVQPEVTLLRDQHRHRELLEKHPPAKAGDIADVWTLVELAYSARELDRQADQFTYLLAAAQLYPTLFQVAWMFEDILKSDVLRARAADTIQPGRTLASTPVGEYLASFLAIRPWKALDRLAAIDRWLAAYPSDAHALKARGFGLDAQRHDQEAADAHLKALEAYPFFYPPVDSAPKALLRLDRAAEAKALLQRVSVWYGPNTDSHEVWAERRWARALRDTGDKGRARQVLDAALKRWPQDATLLAEQVELERADNRKEQAVLFARRAWEQAEDDLDNQIRILKALQRTGELQEALDLFEKFDRTASFRSRGFYARGSQIMGALDIHEARIALMEHTLKDYPTSVWMHAEYASVLKEAGRPQEAWTKLRRALELNPEYSWGAKRVVEYVTAAEDELAAAEQLQEWINRYPWQEAFWEQREKLLTGQNATEQRIALWREAMRQNPGRCWPAEELVDILVKEERWQEARQAAEILFSTELVSAYDRAERYDLRAYVAHQQSRREGIASSTLEQALEDLNAFKVGYGHLGNYYHWREQILRSLDRKAEAAQEQLARARLYPDDTDIFHNLVALYSEELRPSNTIGRGALIVERNPYDGEKLSSVVHKHVMWSGSPIIGLRLIQQIKERGLPESGKYVEGMALGQLGDSVADFEARYQRATNTSGSDRYIGWYENARKAVLNYDRKHVRIDYDAEFPTAEITLPNREILRRVDHPISGKIMSLSKGPAFVRAEYDATGDNLVRISASSGAEVNLEYDDSNHIIQLATNEGQELRFVYNTREKPIEIAVKDLGTIQVTYDENDEITEVKSLGDDGEEADASLASEVMAAMQQLLGLADLLKEARQDVPSLPYHDERRDTLQSVYEEFRWSDVDGERAEAGLALARYLVDHLSNNAEYWGEAREVLSDVIETAQETNTPASRLLAGEAVTLWHRLARETKPKGLPGEDFNQWSEMREWLRVQTTAAGAARFVNWFAEIEKVPLKLFPDDLWLPDSDLQNSGFWRRYGNDGIFPKITPEPRAGVALVRRNGDVVVGSQAGLSVLRRGFWEWFGFDDKTGRFSTTVDIYAISSSSEVLSLAETDDSLLWIGTAKGLYALEDEYNGPVQRWQTEEDGLPSPRIEHLLSRGTEVLVGTASGLRAATPAGLTSPLPAFADKRIRLLSAAGRVDAVTDQIVDVFQNIDDGLTEKQAIALRAAWDEAETPRQGARSASHVVLATLEPDPAIVAARTKAREALTAFQDKAVCRSGTELVDELYSLIDTELLALTEEKAGELNGIYWSTNDPDTFVQGATDILTADSPGISAAQRQARAATLERLTDHVRLERSAASDCVSIEQFSAVIEEARWALLASDLAEIESGTEYHEFETNLALAVHLLTPDEERDATRQAVLRQEAERLQILATANVPVLVGTDTALYVATSDNERLQVTPWPVDAAVWSSSLAEIVVLRGTDVYRLSWNGEGMAGEPVLIPGQQNLRYAKQIYGLAVVQVPDVGEAVTVLTDQGLSFYRDWHFEAMPLPLEQQRLGLRVGPHTLASSGGDMYFLTYEGLYNFERGHVRWAKGRRVYDLVADRDLGLVYIARSGTVEVVDQNDPDLELNRLGTYAAQHLALDNEGRLIANDGHTIIRFAKDSTSAQELFDASPATSKNYGSGPVRALTVASDGTIWVASGGSVFRWKEGDPEEFSFFLDPERFPSRTHMISRVVETIDGKIWVIASDEGHLAHRGVVLEGGLLEWTGEAFRRIQAPNNYRMITGYTRIDDETAIVGSTSGFFRHTRAGRYQSFFAMGDTTYKQLRKRTPLLWLGRKGAPIEERSWLFPSAGGVLLYHQGRWRYPERLNQMLPDDQKLGQYGGRTTHAVAVDGHGRIYAGTDLGLLIYEAGGRVASMLIDNGLSVEAFGDSAAERLQNLSEIILDEIDPGSEQGQILSRFQKIKQEIHELETVLNENNDTMTEAGLGETAPGNDAAGDGQQEPETRLTLKQRLQQRERARQRLLHRLENEHYGLFQMLRLDPRELSALHKELPTGQAVVQYLPTPKKLFIQLVTNKGSQLREVDVTEKELYRRAEQTVKHLAYEAGRLAGVKEPRGLTFILGEQARPDLTTELAWLYEQLLRPIEHELAGMDHIFIVPVGMLTYLPFSALVYEQDGRPKYAVERFAMGSLPSLFHLQLILKHRASYLEESLLIGDPDGTLPSARREVREISEKLHAVLPPLIGEEATFENFQQQAPKSRIVHLATHGVLNHKRPAESYLLMANGYRLNVVDISLLNLEETDLVVLSACESGIGRNGLEYATLARAFAHARVPSVLASLWPVSDPATRQLMLNFYSTFAQGQDIFFAMAEAQRAMIQGDEAWRHPAAWSGFVVFGKP